MTTLSNDLRVSARELFENAIAHHLAGRADAAISAYRETLAADPTLAPAMNNLGALLAARGQIEQAKQLFKSAIAVDPAYGEAHNNLGIALAGDGNHEAAIAHFEAAVAHEPRRVTWWNNLGNSCVECFYFARALEAYDRAIVTDTASADVWSNRGLALRGLRRPDDAIASFKRALSIDPRFTNAYVNLGIVLKEQKRSDEAIAAFETARTIRPNDAALLCNFASVYESRGDYERMRELADLAATLDDSFAEPHVLRGNYYMERGDYANAEGAYQRARSLDAENRNANWNLALIWLLHGDYRRGWAQFEWRKRLQSVLVEHYDYAGKPWNGESLEGRTILLHAEQGLGDAIQFVRYAAVLKGRGAARVIVEVADAVADLLASATGVDQVVVRGSTLPAFDVHASMMDLPRLCGTILETIPATIPYLEAPIRPVSSMIDAPNGVVRVGIVWAGNRMHQRDHLRSVDLSQLAPLFDTPNTKFFSLQKGGPEAELANLSGGRVVDLSPHLTDFRDTAAAIEQLDVVLTVDTSVAHLAAALGCETWIMITHVPDFRWMIGRDDSPWYPTVRLFRQPAPRDWASVMDNVRRALEARLSAAPLSSAERQKSEAPVTMLPSVARDADGRRRFELAVSLADLADEKLFGAYERELLGAGDERILSSFLIEAMRDGDVLVDANPGLGLTSLNLLTGSPVRVVAHVVEPNHDRSERMRRAARDAGVLERLSLHGTLPSVEQLSAPAGTRLVLRIGNAADTAEVLGPLAEGGADISAVAWPAAEPNEVSGAIDVLTRHGFWVGTASIVDGEVSLDPLVNGDVSQTIIALEASFLEALGGTMPDATSVSSEPTAEAMKWLAFDWEVRGDTGWGVYGLNLATQLTLSGTRTPVVLACNESTLPPLVRHRLRDVLEASAPAAQALASGTADVDINGVVLRAYGNGFVGAPHGPRLHGDRNVGVIFFEDTHFDDTAINYARLHDVIIAGSSWNAEVLRAYGLTNVRTVIQGIDPSVFHPAPRAGMFGDRFVVFSGGKLEYRKGQDIVVAAFRKFVKSHPDALLVTAWHNHWPQLIADLELAGHVRALPRVANGALQITEWLAANGIPRHASFDVGLTPNAMMGQIVREADVALFANRCEGGTNLVAMECMAAGVPTILSANTGHLDLTATGGCFALRSQRAVKHPTKYYTGVDGWGESDVDEIVVLLERLYADRELARARAAKGADAMSKLTWKSQIEALLAAIPQD
jgi:tetratricopeptide (TPR) repeat protein/glycosyltransferase involved in cell wall biosynthesis